VRRGIVAAVAGSSHAAGGGSSNGDRAGGDARRRRRRRSEENRQPTDRAWRKTPTFGRIVRGARLRARTDGFRLKLRLVQKPAEQVLQQQDEQMHGGGSQTG
jgi:hypothetical protein